MRLRGSSISSLVKLDDGHPGRPPRHARDQ